MFLILSLIILIAALNIISGLTMLVKEKGHAIAILRTMGATRGAIMRIGDKGQVRVDSAYEYAEGLAGSGYSGRVLDLKKGMTAIRAYEFELNRTLLSTLQEVPGIRIFGLTDMRRLDERVATFSFRLDNQHRHDVAQLLADQRIYVWDGNYYALNVTERLGVEDHGGMVRVGAAHYNTLDEIARLGEVLQKIAK
jgi:selenocysteine lyase/cysteine desulfurase